MNQLFWIVSFHQQIEGITRCIAPYIRMKVSNSYCLGTMALQIRVINKGITYRTSFLIFIITNVRKILRFGKNYVKIRLTARIHLLIFCFQVIRTQPSVRDGFLSRIAFVIQIGNMQGSKAK